MTISRDMTFKDFMDGGQLQEDLADARAKALQRSKENMSSERQKAQDYNASVKARQDAETDAKDRDTDMDNRVSDAVSKRLKKAGIREGKALDPALAGAASIRQTGAGGRKYPERKKSEGERKRTKAIGGGRTAPAASYKDRKDIGATKARSDVEQQPTRERGSAALSAKEQQRKAYRERKARESGGSTAPKKKEAEKAATELLKKKTTKAVAPGYKPQKASGMTRAERDKRRGEGERMLKGIMKTQETDKYKKETGQSPDAKGRTKILGRVNKRMNS